MKLGPLVIQVEVSREPCNCGAGPVKATVPVTVGMTPTRIDNVMTTGLMFNVQLAIDSTQVERDAVKALACKRCEL